MSDNPSYNLVDIASRAGVSRSTVSRVINNDPNVKESTRQKVLQVIREVGYVPNAAARILRTQRTRIIGVVIPDRVSRVFDADNAPYYNTLIQGIAARTQQRDYAMLLWLNVDEEGSERYYERILQNRLMDGLLIVASVHGEQPLLDKMLNMALPFVMIGRPMTQAESISYVSVDNMGAAQQAVAHLLQRGARRVAYIAGQADNIDSQERLEGYQRCLDTYGLPYDETLVQFGQFSREWGYRATRDLLAHAIDGVFAGNDLIAHGALQAVQEAGLCVPGDVRIVGFDDLPIASQTTPTLTTIRQPLQDKATTATDLLLDHLDIAVPAPQAILLPTELVQRDSA